MKGPGSSDDITSDTVYSIMSCSKKGDQLKRGAWSKEEDEILTNYVNLHGDAKWRRIANNSGLKRCGKSCRLRWLNYLRPNIKRGGITVDEEDLIIRLHRLLGNRWSLIAGRLPGRTDNEIKNYCNNKLMKKLNKTDSSSLRSNKNNAIIVKSEEDAQKSGETDTRKALGYDPDEKMVTNKNEMIFLSNENNVDFLADIGCGFSSGLGFANQIINNLACSSSAQGSVFREDHCAKLLDVKMDYSGDDRDLAFLDTELKKLASFLDLDDDDQMEDIDNN